MQDFVGSVAQEDVTISTETRVTTTNGENFYSVMYLTGEAVASTLVTQYTYANAVDGYTLDADKKAFMLANLQSLFAYTPQGKVYIVNAQDFAKYKYKAYLVYVEPSYTVDTESGQWGMSTTMQGIVNNIGVPDSDFSAFITDFPVISTINAPDTSSTGTTYLLNALKTTNLDFFVIARGCDATLSFNVGDGGFGYSPALYQVGRTMNYTNISGTPLGNSWAMAGSSFADVLLTRSIDSLELQAAPASVSDWLEELNICYFKPIGNGTGNVCNFGFKTLMGNYIGAKQLVAYINYMLRVATAGVITTMNTYKTAGTYDLILAGIPRIISPFVTAGRLTALAVTAPSFGDLPASNGHTIIIPNAWEATYLSEVTTVRIGGTLYIND